MFSPKRFFLLALFFATPIAAQTNTWSGILVSSSCNADEAFAEAPDCTKNISGSKLSLMDDTTRVMYSLEPQSSINGHLGDAITIHGTLNDESIQITSVEPMISLGIAVGQKAPAFSLRDQFGHTQTLDSLKGPRGTVLLFFRSADW